ncbi:hypothetical protein AB0M48_08195 [Lentzea sp. NPDC051208]|uniref:hypothetical protein n=1 Tax=Lentzea sp. NPDC051208 TaxID=3154642 RepID=UPI0034231C8A
MSTWIEVAKIVGPATITFFLGRWSKRLDTRQEAKQLEAEKAPSFVVERVDLTFFDLRNNGTAVATGVTLLQAENRAKIEKRPDGVTLGINEATRFMIRGMSESRIPPHFVVICDQLDGEVHVPSPRL